VQRALLVWQSGEMRRSSALACFPIRPGTKPPYSRLARRGYCVNVTPSSYTIARDRVKQVRDRFHGILSAGCHAQAEGAGMLRRGGLNMAGWPTSSFWRWGTR